MLEHNLDAGRLRYVLVHDLKQDIGRANDVEFGEHRAEFAFHLFAIVGLTHHQEFIGEHADLKKLIEVSVVSCRVGDVLLTLDALIVDIADKPTASGIVIYGDVRPTLIDRVDKSSGNFAVNRSTVKPVLGFGKDEPAAVTDDGNFDPELFGNGINCLGHARGHEYERDISIEQLIDGVLGLIGHVMVIGQKRAVDVGEDDLNTHIGASLVNRIAKSCH